MASIHHHFARDHRVKIFDDDDDDDDDDCEQRLWIVTHGRIEVTLQCLWTFRGVAEKLDVDTATKTWLYYSLYLLTAPTL